MASYASEGFLTEQLRLTHLLPLDSIPSISDLDPDDDPL